VGIDDGALRATDPDTLLPGEAESARLPEDAAHWVAVYSELIDTMTRLLERRSSDFQDETERADVRLLETQVGRFRRRLEYWQGQVMDF